jgi:4-hydroxybenzoate polyprenyltransferase
MKPGFTAGSQQLGEERWPSIFRLFVTRVTAWSEFIKLPHSIFALPFALASMAVAARDAHGWPGWRTFGLIIAAMVCARTCGIAFNRIVNRRFDAVNPRTAGRLLPAGRIWLLGAWIVCLLGGACFVLTSYNINRICFYLSPVALMIVCFCSFTKRFTDFTHFFLGLAFALAPLGAWLAVRGGFEFFPTRAGVVSIQHSAVLPLLLAVSVVFWHVGFDIIYAIQDYEFDRLHGIHSLVVRWGITNALRASFLAHLVTCLTLAVFGLLSRFWVAYWAGMAIIISCLILEHWLARRRRLRWIETAFFRLNAVISVVFLVVTVAEVVFPRFRFVLP